jgi:nucleoside-diphosphate-sugar epimerase
VTGATGFIGRQTLVPLQRAGYEVHATCRNPARTVPGDGTTWHAADLLHAPSAERLLDGLRPHTLLHLAWGMEHSRVWHGLENLDWLAASVQLARHFVAAGGQRIVGVGSCAEYDWTGAAAQRPLREDDPIRPASLYGGAKAAACATLALLAPACGLSWAWGRLFHLYGPHEDRRRLVPHVITTLLAGDTARCTAGTQMRDFMAAGEAGRALAALTASAVQGPVNIATGQGIRIAELVGRVAEECGGGRVELGAVPMRPGEADTILADITRLAREVGFTPAVPPADGLAETVAWWRQVFVHAAPG